MNISMQPVGTVIQGRKEKVDDYWGDSLAVIELDAVQFDVTALAELSSFSHLEIIFYFHQVADSEVLRGSAHPRGNSAWPSCGIFAQRKKDRPNKIGVSVCVLEKVDGLKIHVRGLDAVEGTPILDIKPVITGFVPDKAKIREPEWAKELMRAYYKNEKERAK